MSDSLAEGPDNPYQSPFERSDDGYGWTQWDGLAWIIFFVQWFFPPLSAIMWCGVFYTIWTVIKRTFFAG